MSIKDKLYGRALGIFRSAKFFYVSIVVFAVQTSWLALSGLYSMAFDENYHLSIIRLYSDRFLPFGAQQPEGPAGFGAISRDPSYMYQYLLSFPYRLIELYVQSETIQVILLRFISIALFILGIILYRKVLLNAKCSKAMANFVIAVFILTPVVPFLAVQINYDNLLFPLVAGSLLLAQRFVRKLEAEKAIDAKALSILVIVCLFGSLVKYAFLPVFLGVFIFIGVKLVAFTQANSTKTLRARILAGLTKISKAQMIILVSLLLLFGGLFFERYGINTLRYGTPTPECDQVLGIEKCQAYGSWLRNYQTRQDKINGRLPATSKDPINYTITKWMKPMSNNLFYTLNGSSSNFKTGQPFMLIRVISVATIGVGSTLFVWWQRELRKKFKLNLPITVMLVYTTTLWSQNYLDFLHVGMAVAIQARYLVPVLPIFYLLLGIGFARLLQRRPEPKVILALTTFLILITQGGGIGVYILRSDASWYWPNATVVRVNNATRNFLSNFTIGR